MDTAAGVTSKSARDTTATTSITVTKTRRSRTKLDWAPEADAQLLDLRTVHDKKWLEIGQQLGREPASCMNRFESTLNPALKGFWTPERDQQLDKLVTSSKTWADIAQILGVHRLACIERWRQLELQVVSIQVDQGQPMKATRRRKKQPEPSSVHDQQQLWEQQRQRAQKQMKDARDLVDKVTSNVKLDLVNQIDKDYDRLSWNMCLKDEQRYTHYRSWKKKALLDDFSQLYLMNPGWSAKEETVLIQFVLRHGLDQWDVVAMQGLKGRFKAAQCRTCWKNLDMPVVEQLTSCNNQQQQQQSFHSNDNKSGVESLTSSNNQQHQSFHSNDNKSGSTLETSPLSSTTSSSLISGERKDSDNSLLIETIFNYEEENAWTKEQQIHFWRLWSQHSEDWGTIAKIMNTSMVSCKNYFTDITRHFSKDNDGYISSTNKDDNPEFQERIWALARAITQDFKRLPRRPSLSDKSSGICDSEVITDSEQTEATTTPEISTKSSRVPFVWNKEFSVRLQTFVRQAYKSKAVHLDDINWLWVSRRIHPDVTSRICKNHWKFLHDNDSGQVWSHEDIRTLEEGVRLLGSKRLTAIRDHFLPHITKNDIVRQWFRISDKATVINEGEYYQLLGAVKDIMSNNDSSSDISAPKNSISLHDTSTDKLKTDVSLLQDLEDPQSGQWAEVEKRMGQGWKKMPCKRVWESSFQYLIRHAHWTNDEDNTLLRMVKFVGRDDWYSVAKAMECGKSAWQCRLRWCQLVDPVDLDSSDLFVNGEKYY
ncbi:hypothetical protein BGZ65_002059 [Modicella reniformis]|uniref:Uncharacterized protein n=1 Tax=Modicella reniformis TaxID=1440133 RepID=A0A9P6LZN9_9FUNG|nr:hypothetical protein BGZ65_002059 [Modicella reniformis]